MQRQACRAVLVHVAALPDATMEVAVGFLGMLMASP